MKLNAKQREFLNCQTNLAVIAGPGTGKTHALAEKIKLKAKSNKKILALTFTNKAARELASRAGNKNNLVITTFHGFCFSLLKDNYEIKLIDEYTRRLIIKQIAKTFGIDASEAGICISVHKGGGYAGEAGRKLCQAYDHELKTSGYWDFDDFILEAQKLTEVPKFDYLFVDEFQDTNPGQYRFLHKLSKGAITQVIGDPNQAIYAFRGSQPAIFDAFIKDYQSKLIVFNKTYRSTQPIVDLAQALFTHDIRLITNNQNKGELMLVETANEFSEAEYVVADIKRQLGGADMLEASGLFDQQDLDLSDIAILTRTHFLGKVVKKTLAKNNIPYQDVSGESLYMDKKIAFIISVLRFLEGKAKNTPDEVVEFSKKYKLKIGTNLSNTVVNIAREAGISKIDEFIGIITHYDKLKKPIQAFLTHLDNLAANNFYDPRANAVSVITIHAAKGLEFENVYLLGFEEGVIPSTKAQDSLEIAEEKRLLYVALTRAKTRLIITYAQKRNQKKTTGSRFYKNIHKHLKVTHDNQAAKTLEKIRIKKLKKAQTNLFD